MSSYGQNKQQRRPTPAPGSRPRVPPHSKEAEQSVIGSVLLDPDAMDLCLEIIDVADFYEEVHRSIFDAMKDLYSDGEPIDTTTLLSRLKGQKTVQSSGGVQYILQLANSVPSAANVKHYAQIVRDKSVLRSVISITAEAHEKAYGDITDVSQFLDEVEREVFSLAQTEARAAFYPMREIIKETFVQIEALYERKEKVTGVTTGFADLDEMTAGWQPSDLIILAARPSMGKTALSLNLVANAAVHAGVPTAFFSLEMSKEQLAMRLLCSEARIDNSRLRGGFLTENEWSRLIKGAGLLSESNIFIDDTPALPVMKMQAKCRRLKAEQGLGLIVVDYLQLMKGDERLQSREQVISDISRNLKAIAKELNVPVIALSQLNRGVDSRTDKRPMLSDLRESGAIEQDADIIMFIYRDEVYNKDTEEKGIAEIIIGKQRNGAIGTVKLKWFGQYTRFETLARGPDGAAPF